MTHTTRTTRLTFVLGVCLLAFTACGKSDASKTGMPMSDSAGMQGMADMKGMGGGEGMPGMSGAAGMSNEMQAHMSAMMAADGAGMKGMMAEHRQMVANMLAKMNGEMSSMQMSADAQWTATVDSLRQDLVRMPDLDAAALKGVMPGHEARVRRLAAMHAAMMKEGR